MTYGEGIGNLLSSYRVMCSEDAIDSMEEASEKIDEVIELLGNIAQNRRHNKIIDSLEKWSEQYGQNR